MWTNRKRLADAGMIDYDGNEVELTDEAAQLDVYLDVVPEGSIPWGVYSLGLSGLSAVVPTGVWVDVVPTGFLSELGWAALILAAFSTPAVVQVVQSRQYRLGDMNESL